MILAGALTGSGGLAFAAEDEHGHGAVAVDVEKDVAVELGETEVDANVGLDAKLGDGIALDVEKKIEVDLGKALGLFGKVRIGL